MVEKEDLAILEKLIHSLEEAEAHLEEAYKTEDKIKFNNSKRLIIELQKKITGILI
jgi:exonuclease VII small subunit